MRIIKRGSNMSNCAIAKQSWNAFYFLLYRAWLAVIPRGSKTVEKEINVQLLLSVLKEQNLTINSVGQQQNYVFGIVNDDEELEQIRNLIVSTASNEEVSQAQQLPNSNSNQATIIDGPMDAVWCWNINWLRERRTMPMEHNFQGL